MASRDSHAQGATQAGARIATAWLALAVASLGASTLLAVVLVAARTPGVAEIGNLQAKFRVALTLHVDLAALVWFAAFGAYLWSAGAGSRWQAPRWAAFGLSVAGVAAMILAPLAEAGAPLLSNYVPVLDSRVFLAGLCWFLVGAAASALFALPSEPRGGAAGLAAKLAALAFLAACASALWSGLQLGGGLAPAAWFELLSWGPGHIAQGAFTLLMVAAWLELAAAAGVGLPRGASGLAALALLPPALGLGLHFFYAPDTADFRKAHTLLMAWGSWPAPALLALLLLARLRGATGEAGARAALILSMLLFAAGCVVGAFIRTDNTMIPAHYHGTIGAVTLAMMGLCLLRLRRSGLSGADGKWVGRQALAYGTGLLLMVAGLAWAGALGAPRKTPLAAGAEVAERFAAHTLSGIGGAIAILASALFVLRVMRILSRGSAGAAMRPGGLLPAQGPQRRADVRPAAFALTLLAIVAVGLAISNYPAGLAPRQALDQLLGNFRAVDRLSHVAEKQREEVGMRFQQGVMMLHAKQYEHALTALHRVLELAPEMPEAHVNMGFALVGLGRFGEARAFFEGASELRPEQANIYYGLAVALEGVGDLEGAMGAMRTYVHLSPPDDPYRRKAEAALWEWESELARRRAAAPAGEAKP